MLFLKTFIKFLSSKITTLKFLERLSQNIIWRKIMAKKRPKIVSSATGKLNAESWDNLLNYLPKKYQSNDVIFKIRHQKYQKRK